MYEHELQVERLWDEMLWFVIQLQISKQNI